MRTYESLVHSSESKLGHIAERALGLYGLSSVDLSLISSAGDVLFQVDISHQAQGEYHPYLGKLNGKRFLLQVRGSDSAAASLTYSEIAWIAELLRDTELSIPEPVPSCSGALITEIEGHDSRHSHQCVLFRWPEGDTDHEHLLYLEQLPQWIS